jgi:hypothetical protein
MMVLAGTIILLLLPVMAWGMGRQSASTDWDAPAEERAEAASDSWRGIGLTFLLLALLFAILFSAAPLALVLRP